MYTCCAILVHCAHQYAPQALSLSLSLCPAHYHNMADWRPTDISIALKVNPILLPALDAIRNDTYAVQGTPSVLIARTDNCALIECCVIHFAEASHFNFSVHGSCWLVASGQAKVAGQ